MALMITQRKRCTFLLSADVPYEPCFNVLGIRCSWQPHFSTDRLARYEADDVAWFDFHELCDGPRSQNDYIELAMVYHAVLLSDIPVLDHKKENAARRFISLVDEFYDRGVKLIISAAAPITELYQGERLKFEFERTESRLLEMQSHEYLMPHLS